MPEGEGEGRPRPRRILVVDDEPNTRLTLQEALEPLGYEILLAASGDEAAAALADRAVELVLLDLKMPGIDGLEVLRRIERDRPGLRVIVVTAHGTVEGAVESMKHGALDMIQKPFSLEEIRSLVRREMDLETRDRGTRERYLEHVRRARELILERRFDAAAEHLEKAIDADERRPEALNLLGVLTELRGDRAGAQRHWRVALLRDGTYQPAQRNLSRTTHVPGRGGPPDLG